MHRRRILLLFAALFAIHVDAGELDERGILIKDENACMSQCMSNLITQSGSRFESIDCAAQQEMLKQGVLGCLKHVSSTALRKPRRSAEQICMNTIKAELRDISSSNCVIPASICKSEIGMTSESRQLQITNPPIVIQGADQSGTPILIGSVVGLAVTGALATRYVYKRRNSRSTYIPNRNKPPSKMPRQSPPTPNPMYNQIPPTQPTNQIPQGPMVSPAGFSKPIPVYQPPGGQTAMPGYMPSATPVAATPAAATPAAATPAAALQAAVPPTAPPRAAPPPTAPPRAAVPLVAGAVAPAYRRPAGMTLAQKRNADQLAKLQQQQKVALAALQAEQQAEETRLMAEYTQAQQRKAREDAAGAQRVAQRAAAGAQYRAAEARRLEASRAYKAAQQQHEQAQKLYAAANAIPPPGMGAKASMLTSEQLRQMQALKVLQVKQQSSRGAPKPFGAPVGGLGGPRGPTSRAPATNPRIPGSRVAALAPALAVALTAPAPVRAPAPAPAPAPTPAPTPAPAPVAAAPAPSAPKARDPWLPLVN